MSDQPEAFRLIDTFLSKRDLAWHVSASAELRRLQAENEKLRAALLRIKETKVFLGAIAQEMMDDALRREEKV